MPAISVGSVEVDVVPNAQGIYSRLRAGLVPPATRVGDEVGRIIGRQIVAQMVPAITNGINNGARAARPAATRQGDDTAGAFGRAFRARLQAAMRNLPRADVRLGDAGFNADLDRLRARLQTLSNKRIGVDVDAATALAEIDRLEADLRRLGAQHPDVNVRVDTGQAIGELAALRAEIARLDGQNVNVDVDASTATASFNALTFAAVAFGPAILPVLPVVAAGLGSIAAAATAAGAGLGAVALVAVPAFHQIGTVLQAQKAAQDASTQSTNSGGQAASQAASKALQLASAQQAVATAARNGARQIAQAQQAVTQARQNAAQVAQQAAQRSQQAARAVQDAEKGLADAQKASRQAQLDLTAARKAAAQELLDLNNQLTDSQLSQRDAQLQVKEAQQNLNSVNASGSKATSLQRQQAQLQLDQAVQRLKEQTEATKRLTTQTAEANKAGVKGTSAYKTAQDALAKAQQQVADKATALKDAQADQARTATQNAQQIAAAQQKIADAQKNVAVAQQNAADSAASAQRQLQQAQQQTAGGANAAATAQERYRKALAGLTPSARQTFFAFTNLKTAFSAWSRSLQPAVMPIFTRALNGMRNALPKLTPFVYAAADAIKDLQDRAAKGFQSKWWKDFVKDLQTSVKPAITGLGISFGRIFKGIVLIIDAFLPHMGKISDTMQRITGKFADWAKGLKGSPEFERFLGYAGDKAPLIADAFGKIFDAFLNIGQALSPLSGPLLKLVGGLAQGVGWLAQNVPGLVPLIYGLYVATKLWAAWQIITNGAMVAFNLISMAGPWGWIALGIIALVLVIGTLWRKCEWFRKAIKVIWDAIKTAAIAVKDWFAGPFARFFTQTLPRVFSSGWNAIKQHVLYPIRDFFTKTIPGWTSTLGHKVTGAWGDMRSGISGAWSKIKSSTLYPVRDFFTKTIPGWGTTLKNKIVGAWGEAVKGIKKAWDKLGDVARKPVKFVVDTVYNNGIRRVWNLVTDAFGGKHLDPMKFATGGIMPGYTPGRDVHMVPSVAGPVGLSGGEAIMRPEWTRAVGAGYVGAMNAAARSGGVGGVRSALGFKDGGIFSGIGDLIGSGWDKVKKGAKWLADTFGGAVKAGVKHVVNPLINQIPGGNIGFTGLLKDLMKGAVSHLLSAGKKGDSLASPKVNYSPSKGVEQWRPVVLKALAAVHQPRGLAQSTLRRMQQESGGNPTIVNKWDSNWQAGHPSVGLMQVIGPTFRSYAGKYRKTGPFSYGVSVNPMANIYSSMKYALGAYGSLSRAYDRAGGYDSGGFLAPGMNLAFNGTGRPEPVLTTNQWNAITGSDVRGSDGAQQPVVVELHTREGELGQFIDVRVREHQQDLIQVINAS